MKRDLNCYIVELDGSAIRINPEKDENGNPIEKFYPYGTNGEELKHVTIGFAIASVLGKNPPDGTNAAKNVTAYKLARKLRKGGVQELTSEEVALIREICGKAYISLYWGQISEWCDNDYIDPVASKKHKNDEEPVTLPIEKPEVKPKK